MSAAATIISGETSIHWSGTRDRVTSGGAHGGQRHHGRLCDRCCACSAAEYSGWRRDGAWARRGTGDSWSEPWHFRFPEALPKCGRQDFARGRRSVLPASRDRFRSGAVESARKLATRAGSPDVRGVGSGHRGVPVPRGEFVLASETQIVDMPSGFTDTCESWY